MRKFLLSIMMSVIAIGAMAQATSLVVDNQTPGWLSSKINYGDQLTVVNLKVTGYINKDDLSFIGDLSANKKLQGKLDLSEANFVGMGYNEEDNEYYERGTSFAENYRHYIKGKYTHFIFPKSLKKVSEAFNPDNATADTVTIGGKSMSSISPSSFYYASTIKHLIIREGVDSILRNNRSIFFIYSRGLVSLHFPSTLKYVENTLPDASYFSHNHAPGMFSGHSKLIKVNLPDSIESLQDRMFEGVPAFNDTVRLPKHLKEFYPTTFGYFRAYNDGYNGTTYYTAVRDSQVVYIPDSVSIIHFVTPEHYWECHVSRTIPLTISKYTGNSYKNIHVYVPKSALKSYQESNWSAFTLHAEPNPANMVLIKEDTFKLQKGYSGQLLATILPNDADYQELNWYSANNATATVDANGRITAVSSGSTYIYVSLVDNPNLKDSCLVTVYQPVTGIQLNNSKKEIKVGESFNLTTTISPYDADDKSVIWQSGNDTIAIVVDGKVTGVKSGTVMIKAISASNQDISATCEVTVLQPAEGIRLDKDTLKLQKGYSSQLLATVLPSDADFKELNWTSANDAIAKVDTNGKVVAVSSGSSYIYVSLVDDSKIKDSCLVTVYQPVTGIQLNKTEKEIKVGKSFHLTPTIIPYDADNKSVIWQSENESIATVVNGRVTGIKAGTVVIKAISAYNQDISATCEVTVLQPVESIQVNKNNYTLNEIGDIVQLTATVLPVDASNKDVNWRSSDESICIVSNGKVVAVGYGMAIIMATTADGGYMATCTVKVEQSTTGIESFFIGDKDKYEIFDITGKKLESLHRGINIIKLQNGKVGKIIIK